MVAVAGGGNHKTMIPAAVGEEVAGGTGNTNAKEDHHIAIYFIDSPQQTDDRLILSDKTNGQDYSFQQHLQTPSSPPCYSTDHMLGHLGAGADQRHYNYNNGSSSSSHQHQQQQQQQHEHSSRPPRRIKQSRTRRPLAAVVPFVSKIKWGPLWDRSKEWIKNPMNMALFMWIVAVGISGAILFMVMTGMLNAVLCSKAQKDTWFEVNNQILNALFTLMCLYNHPRRFYHLALLCRWLAGDMAALRETYCKGGTAKPNERRHMMVVILLLHLNCLAQYALCGLNLGLSRTRRPPVGVGLTVSVAICAPVVASLYNNLSSLRKDYEVQAAADEESSSSSGSRQLQQKKTVERRYSFSTSPQRRGEMRAVVVAVATEEEDGTSPEWSGGLVADLWEDISLAYLSLFCSCCVFGWNAGRLGFGNAYVHAATFILLCLAPFFIFTLAAINIDDEAARLALSLGVTLLCVLGLLYGGFWRIQMRRRFGLPGNGFCCGKPDVTDCFQWLCCCPCSLAQEVRTADAYDSVHHRMVSRRNSRRPGDGDDQEEEEDPSSSSRVQMQQPLRFAGVFASESDGGMTNTNSDTSTSTVPPVVPVGIQKQ